MIDPAPAPLLRRASLALLLALALPSVGLLQGCVYRMTVQQGNFLDPKQVAQLQTGMTRSQVRFLLGTPMLPDAFDRDRWDYLYYLKIGRLKKPEERRLTVFFEGDKVARIENVGITVDAPPAEIPKTIPASVPAPGA
jgi:outer membrane protein assembly factor BamE